ncbi:hypothetical protein ACHQM5_025324 [Ranunculus cassubicifolius]
MILGFSKLDYLEKGLITLLKDKKVISRVQYIDSPIKLRDLNILDIEKSSKLDLSGLPHFLLHPACYGEQQKHEWKKFTEFLLMYNRLQRVVIGAHFRLIWHHICYGLLFADEALLEASTGCMNAKKWSPSRVAAKPPVLKSDRYLQERDFKPPSGNHCTPDLSKQTSVRPYVIESKEGISTEPNGVEKNYFQSHPKVLPSLSQSHSAWIFGAIAELVDNARDAKATKLEISIQTLKKDETEIPMLLVIDDGHGMSHEEILGMLSFGREAPEEDDPMRIGRFGFGFKTGSMRIGRDAIVFTQTATSRSIGLLSQSLNEGKKGRMMEFDTSVHTEATAKYNLQLVQKFSGFNKYFIGALFPNNGTGTQIYIWNLDKYGPKCCLQWTDNTKNAVPEGGDILIRSKRIRARPGQISTKVPMDYSLQSYLEVVFLDPRMKIYVQGSVVKSRPLAKSLNKTAIIKGDILGKSVELTLGRSQLEWEQMNCGIFLYWHGRLIEAYKRVGGMVHNADMGRGVIGVIDVSDLMNDGKRVWVQHTKQAFEDCEVYDKLEEWLGQKTDEYWDNNFDRIQVKKSGPGYQPDYEWVQCDKCRKWRILGGGYKSKNLPRNSIVLLLQRPSKVVVGIVLEGAGELNLSETEAIGRERIEEKIWRVHRWFNSLAWLGFCI